MAMNHAKMADEVVKAVGGKKDATDGEGGEEETPEPEHKPGSLGRVLRAALREQDDEAIEEAVCKIVEKHGGSY